MGESFQVAVTGAGGYIGSRVAADLLIEGHDVVALDNGHAAQVESIEGVDIRDVDVRDRDVLTSAFEGVDAVMHLAAISGVQECSDDPETAFDVNVVGTENVAWFCRQNGVPLVFPCSMAVIGDPVEFPITSDHPRDPLNEYGLTKVMAEEDIGWLARESFAAHVYLKSNLYGSHEVDGVRVGKRTVINIFVERALEREPITVHKPGTQARDFIHVEDVSRAYLRSLQVLLGADDGAETFPVASGECMSVREIAETVQRVVREERGYEPEIEMVENPRDSETAAGDFTVDTTEAREEIGFEAGRDVESAVREMVA